MRLAFVGALVAGAAAVSACQLVFPFSTSNGDASVEGGGGQDAQVAEASSDTGGPSNDATVEASSEGGAGSDGGGDAVSDAGCMADVQGDPLNCGACGHDCQGGACEAGACQPVALASGQSTPQQMALYAATVYWTTYDDSAKAGVWSVAVDGGGMAKILVADDYLYGITAGPHGVYWASIPGLAAYYADGSSEAFVQGTNPQAVTSDDAEVYWSNWSSPKPIYAKPFGSAPTDAAGTPLYTSSGTEFGLAVHAGNLYWTSNDDSDMNGLVAYGTVGGGTPTYIAMNQANPWGISVDSSGVYWANNGAAGGDGGIPEQAVMAQPSGGGSVITIASGEDHPIAVWADPGAPYVYWVDEGTPQNGYDDGTVARAPKGGGSRQILTGGQAHPHDIIGDSTCVYWLNVGVSDGGPSTSGQVMKLVKP